jgi:hypothetical protein
MTGIFTQLFRDRRCVRGRNRHGRHTLGQQVVDDLHFGGFIGCRGRASVIASVALLMKFFVRPLASLMHEVEVRVVETLHHQRQGLIGCEGGRGHHG